MSSTEGTPRRRRPRRAAPLPRVADLDALLRDVDTLRLTLETDLSLAASAMEAGEPALAADILDADREAVANFEALALGRLGSLEEQGAERPARRRTRVMPQAATFVAAAAVVGVLAGVVPQAISHHPDTASPAAATDSLERLQALVEHGNPNEIRAASVELHEQLAAVVATAGTDPAAAQHALLLLSYEQSAIARSAEPSVLADVLRQSQALASAIRAALPPAVRRTIPVQLPAAPTKPPATTSPTPTPKPSPTASKRPAPAPSASSRPSSSPSPSPTNPYPLPHAPLA